MTAGDWIQAGAALITLAAALSALWIAARDRRENARQARLRFELETATRLVEVLAKPAPVRSISDTAFDRTAELTALTAALGERRVPHLWHRLFQNREAPPDSTWTVSMDDVFVRDGQDRDEAITALEAIVAEQVRATGRRIRRRRGKK